MDPIIWWACVAKSPEDAVFAVLTTNPRRAHDDLVRHVLDAEPRLAPAFQRTSYATGRWEVCGRRIIIVTNEWGMRGLSLYDYYDHSGTLKMERMAQTRLLHPAARDDRRNMVRDLNAVLRSLGG